jgi:adenylyl- and sulfurtransferase ThiI
MIVYADGAFLTCLLAPHLDGSVVMLMTGTIYTAFAGWMLMEKGVAQEAREFVISLLLTSEDVKKK